MCCNTFYCLEGQLGVTDTKIRQCTLFLMYATFYISYRLKMDSFSFICYFIFILYQTAVLQQRVGMNLPAQQQQHIRVLHLSLVPQAMMELQVLPLLLVKILETGLEFLDVQLKVKYYPIKFTHFFFLACDVHIYVRIYRSKCIITICASTPKLRHYIHLN